MENKRFYIKTTSSVSGKDAILELVRRGGKNSNHLQGPPSLERDASIYYLDLTTDQVIRCAVYEPNSIVMLKQLGFIEIQVNDFLIAGNETPQKQPTNITINIQVPETINLVNSDDCSITTSSVSLSIETNYQPKNGEVYYYITINASGEKAIHQISCGMTPSVDQNCFKIGNCFKTQEEAENAKISGS